MRTLKGESSQIELELNELGREQDELISDIHSAEGQIEKAGGSKEELQGVENGVSNGEGASIDSLMSVLDDLKS